jgi:Abortive infection alpha
MTPVTDEQAKAVQEVAKASGPIVALVRDAGRFLVNSTVGAIPADLIGVAGGDWLHEVRKRNRARMEAKTAFKIESVDKSRRCEPSPSLVLPLLEAALDESREELQDQWAGLLANAMIDGGSKVRKDFFTTLKGMEPFDVAVLDLFGVQEIANSSNSHLQPGEMTRILIERRVVGFSEDALAVSLEALQASRCIHMKDSHFVWRMTAYGRQFVAACRVE